jgi:iron complex transport system ATP-binding protein
MTAPAIEVRNLTYRIGGKEIVRDVSFAVDEGAFVSIIGPNGAGKTTLLKCINRLLTGAGGEVLVQGKPLRRFGQAELAIAIGYVPQGGAEDVPFTVHEFVMMGRYPHLSAFSSPTRADERAVRGALELTGAAELLDRSCATLSGGERQKVMIAAALAQDARILLLDEPTTFLDPHHQLEVLRLLAKLNRDSGVTVLAVTHDLNAAALCSDRVLALRAGRIAFEGGADELMRGETLEAVFGLGFHFVAHPVSGQRLIVPEAVR